MTRKYTLTENARAEARYKEICDMVKLEQPNRTFPAWDEIGYHPAIEGGHTEK